MSTQTLMSYGEVIFIVSPITHIFLASGFFTPFLNLKFFLNVNCIELIMEAKFNGVGLFFAVF